MEESRRNELANFINNINKWIEESDRIQELLVNATAEELVYLLEVFKSSNTKAWIAQSDIIAHIHDNSGKLKAKVIESIAKELDISRSYCFTLLKINKKIFAKAPDLRTAPFLTITHFFHIINNYEILKKNNVDIINLLREANDNKWSTIDLRKKIASFKSTNEREYYFDYYKIDKVDESVIAQKQWKTIERLTQKIYLLTDINDEKFLEIKFYKKNK